MLYPRQAASRKKPAALLPPGHGDLELRSVVASIPWRRLESCQLEEQVGTLPARDEVNADLFVPPALESSATIGPELFRRGVIARRTTALSEVRAQRRNLIRLGQGITRETLGPNTGDGPSIGETSKAAPFMYPRSTSYPSQSSYPLSEFLSEFVAQALTGREDVYSSRAGRELEDLADFRIVVSRQA